MTDYCLSYPKGSIGRARAFRSNMTDAEKKLWSRLRAKQLGVHFRRQVPQGTYFCDFACISAKLVVEADGGQHYTEKGKTHDAKRDGFLRARGFTVLRFSDRDILKNIDGVVGKIMEHIDVVK
jgi:very-short-patch-repair endonuclease